MIQAIKRFFSNQREKIALWQLRRKIKRAVEKAEMEYNVTRYHHLVLIIRGKVIVRSRRELKRQLKAGMFKKGVTLEKLEKLALYKTY